MERKTFEIPGSLQVVLRIPAGRIRVRATQTTEAVLEIHGDRADEVAVELRPGSGGHLLVIASKDRVAFGFKSADRDLMIDLVVPEGTSVDAETGSADLEATGELGPLSVRTGSGDLRFETIGGDLTAKVASGDVRGGDVTRNLVVHGASGDVDVRRVAGSLTSRTASGDVSIGELSGSAQATSASGDIQLGSATEGALRLQSVSGDISVGVVEGITVWLDLATNSGDATSELRDQAEPAGAATLEIRARAVSGDVRVFSARVPAAER